MTEQEQQEVNTRLEALNLAVRNPAGLSDTAEKIVEDAEKYFDFLKGEDD